MRSSGISTSCTTRSRGGLAAPGVESGHDVVAVLEGDDLPVDVAAQLALRPEPADHRLLRTERPRAPEPVGVPPPQVVVDGQDVPLALLQRPVEDLLSGVVARMRLSHNEVRPAAERQVDLVVGEHDAVEEVDRLAVPGAGAHDLADGVLRVEQGPEPDVLQGDERVHGFELDGEAQRIPQRAVGVGERAEQVLVLAVRASDDDLTVAGEDLRLEDRLVRQAGAERRRLDAQAGDGAAQRDRAQLRDDEGHEAVRKGRRDQVLVGRHALHAGGSRDRVEVDDVVQVGDVESRGVRGALAEEVRGPLAQPHRRIRGQGGQVVEETSGRGAMPLVANRT